MTKELQDLAWSVLPKEFKEEVSDKYIYACEHCEESYWYGVKTELECFFGIDNLTSDAEGEDEMLYVSRKRVQELYSEMQKIVPVSEYDRGFRNAERATLYHLFGSKCLPDEACNVASSDVASSEANVDSSEHLKPKANSDFTPIPEKTFISKWDKAELKPAEPDEKDDCKKFTKKLDNTLEGEIKEPFKEWRDKNSSNVEKLEKNGEVEPKPAEPNVKNLSAWQDEDDPDLAQRLAFLNSLSNEHSEPKYHKGDKVLYKGRLKVVRSEMYPNRCYSISLPNGQSPFCRHESDLEPYTEPREEVSKMKPIESKVSVYLATEEENEEFRQLLNNNGFTWSTGASLTSQSVWLPDEEETKIHNIYPDKTVTYSGYRTPNFLTFSEFKKQYFEENANLSQETSNCDKHFDTILKDGFSKERRLNIAKNFASVLLSRLNYDPFTAQINCCCSDGAAVNPYINIARIALSVADALIAESEKGGRE